MRVIGGDELAAGEVAQHFSLTRPAISQHLRILKDAGLLAERRDGTRRLYRVRPETLDGLRDFLSEFWNDRLRRLASVAEREERKKSNDKRRRT